MQMAAIPCFQQPSFKRILHAYFPLSSHLSTPHVASSLGQTRSISEENLGAGGQAQIDDVLERQSRNASRKKEHGVPHLLLTTRRESLALYREILRYSNLFVWKDQHGRTWRDLLRESTRKEFEAARFEADPEIVNKLIITGRDAMHRTVEAFVQKRQQIIDEEDSARNLQQ
ncbi:hypothetical protein DUNSADRAFT_3218 [Dunaliella salina]|uniref:Complex 1 LYR protein domain-containing protein n=1 Tax=Dunaliella salina TaxID=3046 RepID=A0ABQ7GUD8_DUNSA|nr:hypothetical protein DUNSADRAFT_3218 [Dunaliella salina]|eukprot:KAF5838238.1 hypothetical protein DUNSADRAFT_3218 [Dunaliella salina]